MLGTSFDAAASRHKYSIYPYATSVLLFNGAIALLPEYTLHGDDTHTRDTYVDHFFFFFYKHFGHSGREYDGAGMWMRWGVEGEGGNM